MSETTILDEGIAMMKSCIAPGCVFLLCFIFVFNAQAAMATSSLRSLVEDRGITIRTVVTESALQNDPVYAEALATQFNSATPELALTFRVVHPARDTYYFSLSDLVVNFAEASGMEINGHSLVWQTPLSLPEWLTSGNWTRDELIAILEDHIKTVVGRYKGRIKSWDVVNEAITADGGLRKTIWLQGIGPEYIDLAFQWAHEADPEAMLFYKEFGITAVTGNAIYELVSGLQLRGIPIHGVNIQGHLALGLTDEKDFFDTTAFYMKRLFDLGLQVNITEFEVPIHLPATEDDLLAQADIYSEALQLCLCSPSSMVFETMGFTDRYSWVHIYFPAWGAALISDEDFIPKPAFYSLVNVLEEFYDADTDGIRDDNGSCTRITNPCTGGDTVGCYDNCPDQVNPSQQDQDADGIGDVCDICPADPFNDIDEDEICGDMDNCPEVENPDQEDGSCVGEIWEPGIPDGTGDVCQDSDGDIITDAQELEAGRNPCKAGCFITTAADGFKHRQLAFIAILFGSVFMLNQKVRWHIIFNLKSILGRATNDDSIDDFHSYRQ
jgi:endo-1,4-beta-xylanase